jgi:hypothetical protein
MVPFCWSFDDFDTLAGNCQVANVTSFIDILPDILTNCIISIVNSDETAEFAI